ncbi:MAG: sulfotransferase domain-containing protein [Cyanobacteria bacterium P01_G01_bin.19]
MNIELVERVFVKSGRIATSPIRIMPSFLIIGAKKCGTTSLFNYLCQHPNIGEPTWKEVSYFNIYYGRGNAWYKSFFPISLPKLDSQDLITGEATASYICHPQAPARIVATIPQVKLIALLRNPIDRAYSHYHHTKRIGKETLSFEDAIAQEELRVKQLENESKELGLKSSPAYNYTYLASGMYAKQLKNWLKYFDREQLLILKSEDFFDYPAAKFKQVLNYLKLPNWSPKKYQKYNHNSYSQEIKPSTRQFLAEYFQSHNQKLYELLGVDFGWK